MFFPVIICVLLEIVSQTIEAFPKEVENVVLCKNCSDSANTVMFCNNGVMREGLCQCSSGYAGRYCEYEICGKGFRIRKGNQSECLCEKGWTGAECDLILCDRGRRIGKQWCRCKAGYKGRFCDQPMCVHGVFDEHGRCHCDNFLWTGPHCNETKCAYGNRTANGSCICFGNYQPPLCQSCLPGFRGIECKENVTTDFRVNSDVSRKGTGALAMGLVVGFSVMVCFSAIFLYRCLAVLVEFLVRTARDKRRRRNCRSDLIQWSRTGADTFLIRRSSSLPRNMLQGVSKPPSYEQLAEAPPPSYQDAICMTFVSP